MSDLALLASKLRSSHRLQGKLVIALDATASRKLTWNTTRQIMNSIFQRLSALGRLEISIGYFRGYDGDCQFTDFTPDGAAIESAMAAIDCRAGNTQIGMVLAHFVDTAPSRPSAFVFIGDDQQEPIDGLLAQARTLAAYKIPTFWFLEQTRDTSDWDTGDYKALASASGGVFAEFTESAADRLEELLVAAATFAIGGRAALAKSAAGQALLTQMKGD